MIVLSDRAVDGARAAVPALRAASRLHDALVKVGLRHRVGLVADTGVWDIQHCALLVAVGADAVSPWLGCLTRGGAGDDVPEGRSAGASSRRCR